MLIVNLLTPILELLENQVKSTCCVVLCCVVLCCVVFMFFPINLKLITTKMNHTDPLQYNTTQDNTVSLLRCVLIGLTCLETEVVLCRVVSDILKQILLNRWVVFECCVVLCCQNNSDFAEEFLKLGLVMASLGLEDKVLCCVVLCCVLCCVVCSVVLYCVVCCIVLCCVVLCLTS